jgi:hypothetical protein
LHLLEAYSTNTGSTIDKIYLFEKYYPLEIDKYITLGTKSGMDSKDYSYFQEVLDIVFEDLKKLGYQFVQIGLKDEPPLNGCVDLRGKTDIHQIAYILKRSSLNISNDSFSMHLSSHYNIPLIVLFSPTHPQISGPYFGDKEKQTIIESNRNGQKPSFCNFENPKTIDLIKPEEVAGSIYKLLKIDKKCKIQSVFFGQLYKNTILEMVPDQILHPNALPNFLLNIRMDYKFDENIMAQQISCRKCSVITDKPVNIDLLKQLRGNIQNIIYEIKKDIHNQEFAKKAKTSGLPIVFISREDEEFVQSIKLDYADYGIIQRVNKPSQKDIKDNEKITEKSHFKTNKFLLSNQKIFLSKSHWIKNIPTNSLDNREGNVIMNNDFFEELDYYYIYNKE